MARGDVTSVIYIMLLLSGQAENNPFVCTNVTDQIMNPILPVLFVNVRSMDKGLVLNGLHGTLSNQEALHCME